MARLLIVDDDALVRMYLKQLVDWEHEGYTLADARDGEEALALLAENPPDVLLSDVSMPGMNGVTLLERAKARGFDGGVIMLSCHDDFAYVKTAMQAGADEYLLKNHLNGPDLLRAVQTVREKHEKTRAQSGQLQAFAQKGLRTMQHELLETLLAQEALPSAEQQRLTNAAGLRGRYTRCAVLTARLPADAQTQFARFFELCVQLSEGRGAEAVRFRRQSCALLVDLSDQPSAGAQREAVDALCATVTDYAWRYLGLPVSVGVSAVCMQDGALTRALRQADAALTAAFYRVGTYHFAAPETMLSDTLPPEAAQFSCECAALVRAAEPQEAEARYRAALAAIAHARVQPGVVLHWLRGCDLAAGITRDAQAYAALQAFEDFLPCGAAYAARARAVAGTGLPAGLSPAIEMAARYIRTHFFEQLTLAQVAAHAGLTQNYFSTLFKQEVGEGFSAFLTECRLRCVCERLAGSGEVIKTIAAEAGFVDYQHFCRTFKRRFGLSPAEYRRHESENKTTRNGK